MSATIRICVVVFLLLCSNTKAFQFQWGSNYTMLCDTKEGSLGCHCPANSSDNEVDCSDRNIVMLPNSISFPTLIETVSFRANAIKSLSNSYFVSGRGVRVVDFSYNKISFIATGSFHNLETIRKLDLSHNDIWNVPVGAFEGLADLISLDLSYNKINNFFPEVFRPCANLREMSLRYNPMLFVERISFEYMPSLEVLNLESTGLGSLPHEGFENNPLLHTLVLSANIFKTVPLRGLLSAKSLRLLDLSENPIEVLEDGSFDGLEKLQILTMNHMRLLRSIENGAFKGLNSLIELYMSDNLQLSEISEHAFYSSVSFLQRSTSRLFDQSSVIRVIFRHCGLKKLPKGLLKWDDVQELDLSENPWNCNCHLNWLADSNMNTKAMKAMICSEPSHLAGKTPAGLAASDFTCRLLTPEAIIGLSLLVSLSFLTAFGALVFILYRRRCRWCFRRQCHRYMRVISSREKVDLEWDHGAEPYSERSKT